MTYRPTEKQLQIFVATSKGFPFQLTHDTVEECIPYDPACSLPRYSIVEKIFSEATDHHKDGSIGQILGGLCAGEVGELYCVNWRYKEGPENLVGSWTADKKIKFLHEKQ